MSTQEEKELALADGFKLLEELATNSRRMKLNELREYAKKILRHWPYKGEIHIGFQKLE